MIPCREKKVTRIPAWCGIPDPKGDRPSSADLLKTAEDEWGFGGLAIRLTGRFPANLRFDKEVLFISRRMFGPQCAKPDPGPYNSRMIL